MTEPVPELGHAAHAARKATAGAVAAAAQELAHIIEAVPRTPLVHADGLGGEQAHNVALLAWGRHWPSGRWAAGVSFLHRVFRGRPVAALVTVWLPAEQVRHRRGELYSDVPRVVLVGAVEVWPVLPPVYPHAGPEWGRAHQHVTRPAPAGRYGEDCR